jgi:hypothetical protein
LLGTRHGPALSSCKSTGRHCADNNAGAQRYPFFGSFSDIWRSRHSASSGYCIQGRSLIARWWSPVRSHSVYHGEESEEEEEGSEEEESEEEESEEEEMTAAMAAVRVE